MFIPSRLFQPSLMIEYLSGVPALRVSSYLIHKHYTKLEKLDRKENSSLLGPLVKYEENKEG
jgi:hypothetical protein